MSTILRRGRGRVAALSALLVALAGSTAALTTTGTAQSAPPPGDCAVAFPVDDLTPGQAVRGLTVDRGTAPAPFTGQVLGVLDGGILPGLDLVLVELDSPAIERAGGIWSGMSGSPVYDAATGDLIGAVAYGLTYGSSPIAGLTPFEDMDDLFSGGAAAAAAPTEVEVDLRTARRVARLTDVTSTQAVEGLTRLPMPLGVSGLGNRRLRDVAEVSPRRLRFLDSDTYAMGADADGATEADLVAGGTLGAGIAYGDIDSAAIGTVTSVCADEVVGFGHSFFTTGRSSLTMHPAVTLVVQPESLGVGFKVANLADPVGTITGDHITGITGTFGALPRTTAVDSLIRFGDREQASSSEVALPDATGDLTAWVVIAGHDVAINAYLPGSETQGWTVSGTWRKAPWTITHDDVVRSTWDLSLEAPWDLVNVLYALSDMRGVRMQSVDFTADVSESTRAWRVARLQWLRGGTWRLLDDEHPARVSAGDVLHVRALLAGRGDPAPVRMRFAVPRRLAGTSGQLRVVGGDATWNNLWRARDVETLAAKVAAMTRNDQVEASLSIGDRRDGLRSTRVSGPLGTVVLRERRAPVRVLR